MAERQFRGADMLDAMTDASAVGIPVVFVAGVASFLSPCVLPLVPGYLAYMGGVTSDLVREGRVSPRRLLPAAVAFVLGFTVVFVALGMALTVLGSFLISNQAVLTRVAGALIVLMGLAFLGLIPLPFLYYERRLQVRPSEGLPGTFAMGLAFGFGWTPCIGPALAAALGIAATERTPGRGALLLFVYSLGLGIPFILSAVGVSRLMGALAWIRKRQQAVMRTGGLMLVAVGLLFVFDRVFWLSSLVRSGMEALGLDFWTGL